MQRAREGELFADRFVLDRLAGRGGMGSVYRARDNQTGEPVAVKFLHASAQAHRARFVREAQLLAELQHPGIVRYVADGEAPDGELWLAMEWLEGIDVAERLRTEGMAPAESLQIVRAVAQVLELAHGHGVVHRDIKPSNLFLVGNDPARVKVLDFGVARLSSHPGAAGTRTGAMLGTPGYMSPEQARGLRDVDARADIFSLGCVLFECLVGWAPFAAEHDVAVLAKILLDEPPRLGAHRPDLGGPLEELVAAMLSKSPEVRPASARELVARIDALGPLRPRTVVVGSSRPADALTGGERRLFSVVLAGQAEEVTAEVATLVPTMAQRTEAETGIDSTLVRAEQGAVIQGLRQAVEQLGGALEPLGSGTYLVSLSGEGVATDQAARAVRCALALREKLPDTAIAVATGRGEAAGRFPVGEVIDRAASLLRDAPPPAVVTRGRPRPVHLDALTSGLLGPEFEWQSSNEGGWLLSASARGTAARTLLGRVTPCVGRDREVSRLLGTVEESVEERVARAMLVTAAPGMGKSRLRDELLRQLHERLPEVQVFSARADPTRAGSPFHLLGQIIRQAAFISADDPVDVRRQKLRERVACRVEQGDRERVTVFLGELGGIPFEEGLDLQLRAARRDAQLMADQTRRAFEDWLAVELAAQPMLLVLDDLHWGDLPTVKLLDAALRNLEEAPLTVLALGRPSVHDVFPKLWSERGLDELKLRELPKRAAEQLVRATLGDGVNDAEVTRLVSQAEGNAFFLEELIRAAAAGKREGLPETVLAMVQARLEALDPLSRRILRAASVFGRLFWESGVVALCGGRGETLDIAHGLQELVSREILERVGAVRFAGEEAYSFRHALLHEAAQAMLTDADLKLGHRLAAQWLVARNEPDPLVLGEHWRKAGETAEAMGHFARAAEDALKANDLLAAIQRAETAVTCGASGEALGRLRLLQAEAHQWRGEQQQALERADEALALLPRGSEAWCRAALESATGWSRFGEKARVAELGAQLEAMSKEPPDAFAFVLCAAKLAWPMVITGSSAPAHALLETAERIAEGMSRADPRLAAALHYAGATTSMLAGQVEDWIWHESGSVNAYLAFGDVRHACESRTSLGYALMSVGDFAQASLVLREALGEAERLGLPTPRATALQNLGYALGELGQLDEARKLMLESMAEFERLANHRMIAGTNSYLARIDLRRGELETADREASFAVDHMRERPSLLCAALAVRAEIRLAQGKVAEARADAKEAMDVFARTGEVEEQEALLRLVDAETLWRTNQREAAKAALREAVAKLDERAARIEDSGRRQSFEAISEHTRTRALARAWGL
ncbi:MAG: protein kinase [Deltaproteobacteria bacterium]|nr:protein kinase [Deltaproteobacteria bacterium]